MSMFFCKTILLYIPNAINIDHIGSVMVSMLALSAVDRGFKARLGQTKDYKISINFFSTKHAALRSKSKDCLSKNKDNVSNWSDIPSCGLFSQ
jgi:hypothetical protein